MTGERMLNREITLSRMESCGKKKKLAGTPAFTSRMEKREYEKGGHWYDIRHVIDITGFLKEITENWHTYVSQVNRLIQQNPIKKFVLTGIFTIVLGFSAIHTSAAIVPEYTYQVKAGDTADTIAAEHGVTVQGIYDANGISSINSGQKLLLPKVKEMAVTADTLNIRSQPTVKGSVVGYFKKGDSVKVSFIENGWAAIIMEGRIRYVSANYLAENAPQTKSAVSRTAEYSVKPGDTFYKISKSIGVSVASIQALNQGVDPAKLKAGQSIKLPVSAADTQTEPAAAALSSTAAYVVHSGDTFYKISQKLGVSVSLIQELNPNIVPEKLKVGQTIHIPKAAAADENYIKVEAQIIDADSKGTFLFSTDNDRLHSAKASGVLLNELIEHKGKKLLLTLKAKRGQEMTLSAIH